MSVNFSSKGEHKSSFGVQHRRLLGPEQIEPTKAFWNDAIAHLDSVASTQGWL